MGLSSFSNLEKKVVFAGHPPRRKQHGVAPKMFRRPLRLRRWRLILGHAGSVPRGQGFLSHCRVPTLCTKQLACIRYHLAVFANLQTEFVSTKRMSLANAGGKIQRWRILHLRNGAVRPKVLPPTSQYPNGNADAVLSLRRREAT